MRRTRLAIAVFALIATSASAHERCGCEHRLVLNGRLNTYDFDGGVGDRFGDGGMSYGGTYVMAGASGFAGSNASASAAAHASASVSISTSFFSSFHGGGGGMHGGGMHGGGMHGGYGGHH